MQQYRIYSVLLALFAFSLFAYASPVSTQDLTVSTRGANPLTDCYNILVDAHFKIIEVLAVIAQLLGVNANISVQVGQIIAILSTCATAIANLGVVVDLSDTVQITAIATVCAQIIVSIHASITVCASIPANLLAVGNLDIVIQTLLGNLNICIPGILVMIAPLCVNITAVTNLSLPLVCKVLGL